MWGDWEDKEECNPVMNVEGFPCGSGYLEQSKKCDRSLGGTYCSDENGEVVKEDILHKTISCEANECPGWNSFSIL